MSQARFGYFAWAVLAWNILVVLWGAFVSATGSGAGCGGSWPLCNGEVLPRPEGVATLIEFSHRLTSGVALLLVLALGIWAWRAYPRGHRVRAGAGAVVFFIITEALLGAALVLRGWVAFDTSLARVFIQPIHLLNTLLLLAALSLTAWWAAGYPAPQWRQPTGPLYLLGLGLLGMFVVGGSGALISLGDALALALGERYNTIVATLVALRVWHPAIALGTGLYLIWLAAYASSLRPNPLATRLAWSVVGLVIGQWLVGGINVWLRVPLWTQLLHLLLADMLWIVLWLWANTALGPALASPQTQPLPKDARQAAASG